MRGTSSERLALSETAEEREARLHRLTDRLASAETAEERAARLQQMSRLTSTRDWLSETAEDREDGQAATDEC